MNTNNVNSEANVLDKCIQHIGEGTSWLQAVLVVIIGIQVVLRYVFNIAFVALEELQWHLYSVCFLLGFSYAVVKKSHIRTDIIYSRFSLKTRLIIDILSYLLLLLPFLVLAIYHSLFFVQWSFMHNEHSVDALGLPYRWIIKAFIPITLSIFGLAAVSQTIRIVGQLRKLGKN